MRKGQMLHWTTIVLLALIIFVVATTVYFGLSIKHDNNIEVLQLDFADYQTNQQLNQALKTVQNSNGKLLVDYMAELFHNKNVEDDIKLGLKKFFGPEFSDLDYGIDNGQKIIRIRLKEPTNFSPDPGDFSPTVTTQTDDSFRFTYSEILGVDGETILIIVRRYVQ